MATTAPAKPSTPPEAKRSAALFSVCAAALITLLKLVTGLLTGSLGMLSEAAHSAIDLIAAALTLVSIQVADRPADEDHTYGHGKVESLSAFVETGLMLLSSTTPCCLFLPGHFWFWGCRSWSISPAPARCAAPPPRITRKLWPPTRSTSAPISGPLLP